MFNSLHIEDLNSSVRREQSTKTGAGDARDARRLTDGVTALSIAGAKGHVPVPTGRFLSTESGALHR